MHSLSRHALAVGIAILLGSSAQAYVLNFEGLGLPDLTGMPDSYGDAVNVNVTYSGSTNAPAPYSDIFFRSFVGWGDLTNVIIGPYVNSASPPDWGIIEMKAVNPGDYIQLISFDIASYHDNNIDTSSAGVAIVDSATKTHVFYSAFLTPAGDAVPASHTHVNFGGTPLNGFAGDGIQLWFQAKNGFVALDNITFAVLPEPANMAMLVLSSCVFYRRRKPVH